MKRRFQWLWLGAVLLFMYAPILILGIYSFTDSAVIGALGQFSLTNYQVLFTTPEIMDMLTGTLILALIVSLMATALGTVGALGAFYGPPAGAAGGAHHEPDPRGQRRRGHRVSVCILLIVFFGMDKDTYIPWPSV